MTLSAEKLAKPVGGIGLLLLISTAVTLLFGNATFVYAKAGLGLACVLFWVFASGTAGVRRFFVGRAAFFGFFTGVSALVVIALLAALNFAAYKRPKSWDLTKNKIFTLSEDTVKTLEALKGDVNAIAFYRQDEAPYGELSDLCKRYGAISSHFRCDFIDYVKQPELVKQYGVTEGGPRITLVPSGADGKPDMPHKAVVKEPTEQGLTNGLVKLTHGTSKKAYFTEGHGEVDPRDESAKGESVAMKALENEGFEVVKLSLLQKAEIPADAAMVLVVAPRKAFLQPEVEALQKYALAGGKVGVFLEPETDAGLDPLLADWGIAADNDMVVDPNPMAKLLGGSAVTPIAQQYAKHDITSKMGGTAVAFPTVRSLVALKDAKIRPTALALSSEKSWGETNIPSLYDQALGGARYDDGQDKKGPLPMVMVASKSTAGEKDKRSDEARVLVAGDGEFFGNQYQHFLGNLDFFLNSANWLAHQDDRITIRPKARDASRFFPTDAAVAGIRFFTIDALPVALLGLGLAVWMVRRSR